MCFNLLGFFLVKLCIKSLYIKSASYGDHIQVWCKPGNFHFKLFLLAKANLLCGCEDYQLEAWLKEALMTAFVRRPLTPKFSCQICAADTTSLLTSLTTNV